MPYKLRITKEDVEKELKQMGIEDISDEMVEIFRKDLLKLIKADLKRLKKLKEENAGSLKDVQPSLHPLTSTPSSQLPLRLDKVRYSDEPTSEYETGSSAGSSSSRSEGTSRQASSISSEPSRTKGSEDRKKPDPGKEIVVADTKQKERPLLPTRKEREKLPSYPEKVDPVNLYHYYKAHWDKHPVPGEDPRNKLRWEIRSKLFYSKDS